MTDLTQEQVTSVVNYFVDMMHVPLDDQQRGSLIAGIMRRLETMHRNREREELQLEELQKLNQQMATLIEIMARPGGLGAQASVQRATQSAKPRTMAEEAEYLRERFG